jgi:hypothetical protein
LSHFKAEDLGKGKWGLKREIELFLGGGKSALKTSGFFIIEISKG